MTAVDWSGSPGVPAAKVGSPAPCVLCRKPAFLRHPVSGDPCHKVCEEARVARLSPSERLAEESRAASASAARRGRRGAR